METGKFRSIPYLVSMLAALLAVPYSTGATAEQAPANTANPEFHGTMAALRDHEAKASFHEGAAKESQARAQEQKQLLEEYKAKSYLYGRQAQDLQARAHALAREYGKAAKAHAREAALHREKAMQIAENESCNFPGGIERC